MKNKTVEEIVEEIEKRVSNLHQVITDNPNSKTAFYDVCKFNELAQLLEWIRS